MNENNESIYIVTHTLCCGEEGEKKSVYKERVETLDLEGYRKKLKKKYGYKEVYFMYEERLVIQQ